MAEMMADASPEKRLFISLITRDIPLADAFLDLIDNSINAVMEPLAGSLRTADDYQRLLLDNTVLPTAKVSLVVTESAITISDTAPGISATTARDHVFKFGRSAEAADGADRLSVYGIGLKRAIFKIANQIVMTSDHRDGGFSLNLNVDDWERDPDPRWQFKIETREPAAVDKCGTLISLTGLRADVVRRIKDGVFLEQLRTRIGRTYSFFIGRLIDIEVNDQRVVANTFAFGDNVAKSQFEMDGVTGSITAGIAVADARGQFTNDNAGWFVFCNGRTVIWADKTALTGWSGPPNLPLFQPKHRPFLGTVFFVSEDPEKLPWTTTKSSINEEAAVWQEARRLMIVTGKDVSRWLDERYSDEGTSVSSSELSEISGASTGVLQATTMPDRVFNRAVKPRPPEIRIQYSVKKEDVERIATYLRKPSMGGAEVGRYTFDYFLRNRVGGNDA